jgi:hypothetical protein
MIDQLKRDTISITSAGVTTIAGSATTTIGTELISNIVNRDFSGAGNWAGTGWSIVSGAWTHVAGANATTLANTYLSVAPAVNLVFKITLDIVTTTTGTLSVGIGGTTALPMGNTDWGVGIPSRATYSVTLTCANAGVLTITPNTTWAGSIDNVSIKQVTTVGNNVLSLLNSAGVEKASIDKDGIFRGLSFVATSVIQSDLYESRTFASIIMRGWQANGASAVAAIIDSGTTLSTTGAKLLSIRNNGVEKAYIDKDGGAFFNGSIESRTSASGSSIFLAGFGATLPSSANRVAFYFDTTLNYSWLDFNGMGAIGGSTGGKIFVTTSILLPRAGKIASALSYYQVDANPTNDSSLPTNLIYAEPYTGLIGNEIAILDDASATILSLKRGTSRLVTFAGTGAVGIGVGPSAMLHVKSATADGASAVATIIDTSTAWATTGAKLLSIKNNGVEKAYVDKDGGARFNSTVTLSPTISVTPLTITSGSNVNCIEVTKSGGGGYVFYATSADKGISVAISQVLTSLSNQTHEGIVTTTAIALDNYAQYGGRFTAYSTRTAKGTNDNMTFGVYSSAGSSIVTAGEFGYAGFFVAATANVVPMLIKGASGQAYDYLRVESSAAVALFKVDSTGNVGIGTASPTPYNAGERTLHINSANSIAGIKLTNVNTGMGAQQGLLLDQNGLASYIWNGSNGYMAFGTNNVDRVRIDAAGLVGIGITAPTALLQVAQPTVGPGTITITGNTTCTGTGTRFTDTFKVGDTFTITATGDKKAISAITSDTVMTISSATNTVGSTYSLSAYSLAGSSRFEVHGNGQVRVNDLSTFKLRGTTTNLGIFSWMAYNSGGSHTLVNNSAVDPLGGNTATTFTFTGTAVVGGYAEEVLKFNDTGFGNYLSPYAVTTFSVWLKAATGTPQFTLIIGEDSATRAVNVVTLSTSWVRYSLTATAAVNCGVLGYMGHVVAQTLPPDGTVVYIWGIQVEEGYGVGEYVSAPLTPVPNGKTIIDSTSTRILSLRASNVEKAYIDKDGLISAYALTTSASIIANGTLVARGTNGLWSDKVITDGLVSLSLTGQVADGAAAVGVILNNTTSLTVAGSKLVSIRNAGVEKAYFTFDGRLNTPSIGIGISPSGGTHLFDVHSLTPATNTVFFAVGDCVTVSGQPLLYFMTASAESVIRERSDRKIIIGNQSNNEVLTISGANVGLGFNAPTSALQVVSKTADGATAVATIIDTSTAWANAAAKLLSIRNNGVEKAYFDNKGSFYHASGWGFSELGLGSSFGVSGKIFLNPGTIEGWAGVSIELRGAQADGASAIGLIVNTIVNYATTGAKLLSIRNANVEKAYIDKDGYITSAGSPVGRKVGVPATAGAAGNVGDWAADASWLYICTALDTWQRTAITLATW